MSASTRTTRFDFVSLGESMLRLSVPTGRRLDDTRMLDMELAGAESNVSVALARLGWRTGWVSRMPDHALANTILRSLRSDGVDVSAVKSVPDERLGMYFIEYATPLRASARNELTAVASRDMDRAEGYAKERNISRVFGSYEAMLADPDIDVIYNPLPNSMHIEWTIKAAQAGKHVLCEKPLAMTVEEVDAITSAAKKADVVVMEAFMYRHHPQTLKAKELVESGAIGKLQLVRGSFTFSISNEDDVRLNASLGGGSIWDVGCYPISYSRLIIGSEPLEAFGWQITGASGVDETFVGQLRFANNVYAQFDCGFRTPRRSHLEIVGSKGALTIAHPFNPGLNVQILQTNGDKEQVVKIPDEELYLGEVENMADAILNGQTQRMTLLDSRNNVNVIKTLLLSAQEGKPVTF